MSEIVDLSPLRCPPFWVTEWKPLPTELPLFAIGWLGSTVPREGEVSEAVIGRIFTALSAGEYFVDHSLGSHTCELCPTPLRRPRHNWRDGEVEVYGHGFQIIEHEGRAFVASRLLLHYVLAHRYRPPAEFLEAVVKGRFLAPPPLTPEQLKLLERHETLARRQPWKREWVSLLAGALFALVVVGVWKLCSR